MTTYILSDLITHVRGGWKTYGPNQLAGDGAFSISAANDLYQQVSQEMALKVSALHAALKLRAETIGTFPIHILDNANNKIVDHALYSLLRTKPNANMTGPDFFSQAVVNFDMWGNTYSLIGAWENGEAHTLTPLESERVKPRLNDRGLLEYEYDGDILPSEKILHVRGFGMNGLVGIPLLQAARNVLAGQVDSNDAAARMFRQGMNVGGFFTLPETKQNPDEAQRKEFDKMMRAFSSPENMAKWMMLLPGMQPVANQAFRINPVDAELLMSRQFGIEELCRFLNIPPPLIGHTDKASSWASSLENLNQHYVSYSCQPTTIRFEAAMSKLLSKRDRSRYNIKFNMDGLLRGDLEKRTKSYETGIKNGYLCPDDAREKENMPKRADGKGGIYVTPGAATNNTPPASE